MSRPIKTIGLVLAVASLGGCSSCWDTYGYSGAYRSDYRCHSSSGSYYAGSCGGGIEEAIIVTAVVGVLYILSAMGELADACG